MSQGPNVKRLITQRMAQVMIPPGGGFLTGLEALAKPGNIGKVAREATDWVNKAISLVKEAPNNPYGDDDEVIAGEILRQIELKRPPSV